VPVSSSLEEFLNAAPSYGAAFCDDSCHQLVDRMITLDEDLASTPDIIFEGLTDRLLHVEASEWAIMAQIGHRSATTVRRYIREGFRFRENAASGVGL
jgi:hypothetical protein